MPGEMPCVPRRSPRPWPGGLGRAHRPKSRRKRSPPPVRKARPDLIEPRQRDRRPGICGQVPEGAPCRVDHVADGRGTDKGRIIFGPVMPPRRRQERVDVARRHSDRARPCDVGNLTRRRHAGPPIAHQPVIGDDRPPQSPARPFGFQHVMQPMRRRLRFGEPIAGGQGADDLGRVPQHDQHANDAFGRLQGWPPSRQCQAQAGILQHEGCRAAEFLQKRLQDELPVRHRQDFVQSVGIECETTGTDSKKPLGLSLDAGSGVRGIARPSRTAVPARAEVPPRCMPRTTTACRRESAIARLDGCEVFQRAVGRAPPVASPFPGRMLRVRQRACRRNV
jgi:hypothetical protein